MTAQHLRASMSEIWHDAAARTRCRFVRSRTWRVVALLLAAGVAAWSFVAVTATARSSERSWGRTALVWVATADHDPGAVLQAERREVPEAVAPAKAVSDVSANTIVRQFVGAGEVVVDADLAPGTGVAALAPLGSVVVPVADPLIDEAPLGATVIVSSEGVVLADAGVVTASGGGVVHIAVAARDAPMVAAAASQSLASLLFPAAPDG